MHWPLSPHAITFVSVMECMIHATLKNFEELVVDTGISLLCWYSFTTYEKRFIIYFFQKIFVFSSFSPKCFCFNWLEFDFFAFYANSGVCSVAFAHINMLPTDVMLREFAKRHVTWYIKVFWTYLHCLGGERECLWRDARVVPHICNPSRKIIVHLSPWKTEFPVM